MTDPWMVQNSGQQNNSVENGAKDNSILQEPSKENSELAPLEFEDNFAPASNAHIRDNFENTVSPRSGKKNSNTIACAVEPLPDSDNYLRGLERKLQKIKKGANLVEALAEKRNDCLRQLLNNGDPDNNNAVLALDQPLNNPEFYRHLQPVQAISVGELVHIVKYDQLQQEPTQENNDKQIDKDKEVKKEEFQE
ncbi:uncharacterized protein LOC128854902 [Anastrepha ludens]|uniref:uncharacterized protein LOC128854902 n=1 Tax=Anastrepha ludens TaxID=28586 RepID=UPI0023AEBC06|nr:uncharacterized protein LOC128854902 [Anastrepha ludens]